MAIYDQKTPAYKVAKGSFNSKIVLSLSKTNTAGA